MFLTRGESCQFECLPYCALGDNIVLVAPIPGYPNTERVEPVEPLPEIWTTAMSWTQQAFLCIG